MSMFNADKVDVGRFVEFDDHEEVYHFKDNETGLNVYVAIHNSNLGPATGGTRMFAYSTEDDAIKDVLKLSKAMTYKCALAGVRLGGGKAVIIGDPNKIKSEKLIRSYANVIESFNGGFTTGEDSGIDHNDVQIMAQESQYINGGKQTFGDPSPFAALSTFIAMGEACEIVFGSASLEKKKVAIKGVGNVGSELAKLLSDAGAEVYISDINSEKLNTIIDKYPSIKILDTKYIHAAKVDIFSPCALGGEVSEKNQSEIKAKIICGASNNQLENPQIGKYLLEKGIFYVVDYIANCGGLINVVDELEYGTYNNGRVLMRINIMKDTLRKVAVLSEAQKQPTNYIADTLAESVFNSHTNERP